MAQPKQGIEVLNDAVRFWHSLGIIPYKKSVRLP
jgi:hypothetical protein